MKFKLKWKLWKKTFKTIVDNNKISDMGWMAWPYFVKMPYIFGDDSDNTTITFALNVLCVAQSHSDDDT